MKTVKIKDKYIITDDGRVFTYWSNHKKWKEQKCRKNSGGYLRATIFGKDKYVHRLVAYYFVENPNKYKEVNHIDGNKENNCADNLEWCTRSQNNKHAFEIGLRSYDELKNMAKKAGEKAKKRRKFTTEQIQEIRNCKLSDTELSKKYNCARGVIYQIRKFKTYKEV